MKSPMMKHDRAPTRVFCSISQRGGGACSWPPLGPSSQPPLTHPPNVSACFGRVLARCRLLDVLVRQVGRASTSVLRSNGSLGMGHDLVDFVTRSSSSSSSSSVEGVQGADSTAPGEDVLESLPEAGAEVTPGGSLPPAIPLLTHGMRLSWDQPGRVATHRELGVQHTLSLWVRCQFPPHVFLHLPPVPLEGGVAAVIRCPRHC